MCSVYVQFTQLSLFIHRGWLSSNLMNFLFSIYSSYISSNKSIYISTLFCVYIERDKTNKLLLTEKRQYDDRRIILSMVRWV